MHLTGWQQYCVVQSNPFPPITMVSEGVKLTDVLGVLGHIGITAYVGVLEVAKPQPGETFLVSAAASGVGSIAGQIAKLQGTRVIGIAGSAEKCAWVVDELGFDACINYKTGDLASALPAACPGGVDVYFDNVGGEVLAGVLRVINRGARIPLCGMISEYNATAIPGGPNLRPLLVHRAMIKGFIVSDHYDRFAAFLSECVPLVRDGRIKYREDIVEGLDAAPSALIGLFEGRNFGKMLVRVSADPTQR